MKQQYKFAAAQTHLFLRIRIHARIIFSWKCKKRVLIVMVKGENSTRFFLLLRVYGWRRTDLRNLILLLLKESADLLTYLQVKSEETSTWYDMMKWKSNIEMWIRLHNNNNNKETGFRGKKLFQFFWPHFQFFVKDWLYIQLLI